MIFRTTNILQILFILGCTATPERPSIVKQRTLVREQNFRKFASDQMQMSGKELDLAECFQIGKDICYQRYPYDKVSKGYFERGSNYSQREDNAKKTYQNCVIEENLQCAYQFGDKELIIGLNKFKKQSTINSKSDDSRYEWLKLGSSNIVGLWNFISELQRLSKEVAESSKSKVIKSAHGHGVAYGVSAFAGMGILFNGELVVHDQKLALFCAPGVSAVSDLGVQMGVGPVRTIGCNTHQDYVGNFLTVSAGISGEYFGLPAGAEVNYSFGFSSNDFLKRIEYQVNDSNLDLKLAATQFAEFATVKNSFVPQGPLKKITWYIVLKVLANFFEQQKVTIDIDDQLLQKVREQGIDNAFKTSVGQMVKEIIYSEELKLQLKNHDHLYIVMLEFANSMSGCDSVAANALLTVTASPINFSLLMSNYAMLYEEDLNHLVTLQNMSAFMLLNPMLLDSETVNTLLKLSQFTINLPEVVNTKCSVPTTEELFFNARKVRELISK